MKPRSFGRYILVEKLGSGGMGQVYLAVARGLWGFDKCFAVKKILPALSRDPEFLLRFRDEARLVIPMNHANVVQVHEVGRVGDEYFIAMELVDGVNLGKLLAKLWRRSRRHRLPIPAALYLIRELLAALCYCHQVTDSAGFEMRVVHRDVSPANVLVSFDGAVKLADFGLALSALKVARTEPNRVFGHLGYIAPEGLDGLPVDCRADIFSAGVLLFELLTCHRFAPGGDPIVVRRLLEARSRVLPSTIRSEIPQPVDALVQRAVAIDPDRRFSTAVEFHDAVQNVLMRLDPLYGARKLAARVLEPVLQPAERRQRLRTLIAAIDRDEIEDQTPLRRTVSLGEAFPLHGRGPLEKTEPPLLTVVGEQFDSDTEPLSAPPVASSDDRGRGREPSFHGSNQRRSARWRSPLPEGGRSRQVGWQEADTGSYRT